MEIESNYRNNPPAPDMEFVFEVSGKKFYQFIDQKNIPVERALSAMDVYNELDTRLDKEYLDLYFKTVLELLNKGKLVEAGNLTIMAQSRLEHITHIGIIYKLASVVYIEENEDPYRYSLALAEKKIEFWQENEKDINAFFLKMRIKELIPYLDTWNGDISHYSQLQGEELKRQFGYLTKILSSMVKRKDLDNILTSLKNKNSAILNLSSSL